MADTVKSGNCWVVYVGVKLAEGVSVDIMVEVPVGLGVSVSPAGVSAKGCFGRIEGVEVGTCIAVGVGFKIIGKTMGPMAIIDVHSTAMARIMAKIT